jgi:transcription elongation factor GreA
MSFIFFYNIPLNVIWVNVICEREMKMQKTELSERMYKILADHVAAIEREKESAVKGFYSDNAATGTDCEIFFGEYIAGLKDYLKNVKVNKDGADNCPIAIIGSTVEVMDTADKEAFSYRIVLPIAGSSSHDMSVASCLSPIGRALLLKPAGSTVSVNTPGGEVIYDIVRISFDGEEQVP